MLARLHIDLNWADEQYPSTVFKVMGEYAKIGQKPEKKKVGSAQIAKFIV